MNKQSTALIFVTLTFLQFSLQVWRQISLFPTKFLRSMNSQITEGQTIYCVSKSN